MPKALAMFIDMRGQDIIQKNLFRFEKDPLTTDEMMMLTSTYFRNFCLHLVNLFEFGVIGPGHVFTAISRLQVSLEKKSSCQLCDPGLFYSGLVEESWPPARPLLGQPPPLSDAVSRGHQLSHQQKVRKDEEELCWTFHQIYLKYIEIVTADVNKTGLGGRQCCTIVILLWAYFNIL